ncbi:hypothetical protein OIM90_30790 [Streptomyces sp. AD16]|nr:hypothetical protein OIM90_30790 [Streptomyces sp. AD16]
MSKVWPGRVLCGFAYGIDFAVAMAARTGGRGTAPGASTPLREVLASGRAIRQVPDPSGMLAA